MQFTLSFTKIAQLNKLNHAGRTNKDWPSGKAHEVMTQLVKEYEPDDMMAEMEMEKALSKLTLGKKKDTTTCWMRCLRLNANTRLI